MTVRLRRYLIYCLGSVGGEGTADGASGSAVPSSVWRYDCPHNGIGICIEKDIEI